MIIQNVLLNIENSGSGKVFIVWFNSPVIYSLSLLNHQIIQYFYRNRNERLGRYPMMLLPLYNLIIPLWAIQRVFDMCNSRKKKGVFFEVPQITPQYAAKLIEFCGTELVLLCLKLCILKYAYCLTWHVYLVKC